MDKITLIICSIYGGTNSYPSKFGDNPTEGEGIHFEPSRFLIGGPHYGVLFSTLIWHYEDSNSKLKMISRFVSSMRSSRLLLLLKWASGFFYTIKAHQYIMYCCKIVHLWLLLFWGVVCFKTLELEILDHCNVLPYAETRRSVNGLPPSIST